MLDQKYYQRIPLLLLENDFSNDKISFRNKLIKKNNYKQTLSLSPGLAVPLGAAGIPGGGVAI